MFEITLTGGFIAVIKALSFIISAIFCWAARDKTYDPREGSPAPSVRRGSCPEHSSTNYPTGTQ
jgi:hypothetical protein